MAMPAAPAEQRNTFPAGVLQTFSCGGIMAPGLTWKRGRATITDTKGCYAILQVLGRAAVWAGQKERAARVSLRQAATCAGAKGVQ